MGEISARTLRTVLHLVVVLIVTVAAVNVGLDVAGGTTGHVVFELLTYGGALLLAVGLWLGWWRAQARGEVLSAALGARGEGDGRGRRSARPPLDGLAGMMEAEFAAWELTDAEREVAFFLLKGHTHKAIGRLTDRSERTVRQHAVSVYQKSGLAGRAELAAHFLDELAPGGGLA